MTDRIWILGAPDPEMEAIESLLRECGERIVYALDDRGERVTPATAYRCPLPEVTTGSTVYAVECIDVLPEGWVRIDHHHPGDHGYGRPPAEFLTASSIGQVISVLLAAYYHQVPPRALAGRLTDRGSALRWTQWGHSTRVSGESFGALFRADEGFWCSWYPVGYDSDCFIVNDWVLYTAAADHCLGAAYRGECPGVEPDALMHWRVKQRAQFQGRNAEQILDDIERARETLRGAPTIALGDMSVRDLRAVGTVPELPDAASREGVAYLATVSADGSGRPCRPKVVLGGCATADMVRAFLEHWAPANGLVDCYGDPARGFAGGYLE